MDSGPEMVRRFGARVSVTRPQASDRQLFLILGVNQAVLRSHVSGRGGKLFLGGPNWVLAEMQYSQAMALRGAPGVHLLGGVTIDPERWKQIRLSR